MNDDIGACVRRTNRLAALTAIWAMFGAQASVAYGQTAPDAGGAAREPSKPVCVDAEVDGARVLSYDCLNRQLVPTATAGRTASASNPAEAIATSPSNKVGTFNDSAESIRFGANWRKSAFPQRPAPVPAVSPLGR